MSKVLVFCILTLLAIDARAADSRTRAACAPNRELEAAGRALAAGERALARRHLRRAEAQAEACKREARGYLRTVAEAKSPAPRAAPDPRRGRPSPR